MKMGDISMKRFAVICAMWEEAELLVKEFALTEKQSFWPQFPVYEGEYKGKTILVTVCGIGKVYAAMTCQKVIDDFSPDVVLNLGIAGGVAKGIFPGDICISSDFVQYDYDLSAVGRSVGQIDDFPFLKLPADETVASLLHTFALEKASGNVFLGTVGTGDRFVSSSELASHLNETFGAVCCEMEGAAMAQVCVLNRVRFCALRAISDNANEDAHTDVEAFSQKAEREATDVIKVFFDSDF